MPKSYRNHSSNFRKPNRPFEKERLESEMKIVGQYGLKNKREVGSLGKDGFLRGWTSSLERRRRESRELSRAVVEGDEVFSHRIARIMGAPTQFCQHD